MIDTSDFHRLVDIYGADRRRWPADRRADADALLAAEPEAVAAILAGEAALDEALDLLRPPVPSAQLRERILAAAPKPRAAGAIPGLFGWLRPSVGAVMAASCAAGVVAGLLMVAPPERADPGGEDVLATLSAPADTLGFAEDSEAG